jgi:hypothetical protein
VKLPLESAQLAAWASALLAGLVAPDDVADAAQRGGRTQRVVGTDAEAASVGVALAELRTQGARRAWLVWPEPGHPTGLPGPDEANRLALSAGQAVVVERGEGGDGWLLVPSRLASSGVLWTVLHADRPNSATTTLAEADRALKTAIRESTELLQQLDLGRTDPDDEGRLEALRTRPVPFLLPPGYDARSRSILDTAQRLAGLLDLARGSDGAAVSRVEAARRADILRELNHRVRDAFVASVNALAEDGVRDR